MSQVGQDCPHPALLLAPRMFGAARSQCPEELTGRRFSGGTVQLQRKALNKASGLLRSGPCWVSLPPPKDSTGRRALPVQPGGGLV